MEIDIDAAILEAEKEADKYLKRYRTQTELGNKRAANRLWREYAKVVVKKLTPLRKLKGI